jgi:hypothetical protein
VRPGASEAEGSSKLIGRGLSFANGGRVSVTRN